MAAGIKLPGDWFDGAIPETVLVGEGVHIDTAYSFLHCHSRLVTAVKLGKGAGIYSSVMFDLGESGRVIVGEYTTITGALLICDADIVIGNYCLISWNVVIMDTYRVPLDPVLRHSVLEQAGNTQDRILRSSHGSSSPVHIEDNVWIGFDACVLPGVSIGAGSIVAAKSVVVEDVPRYSIVGGNPARVIRSIGQ
jgi:acetyltransferase-like isoleucine patch superfamily enzyme